MDYTKDIHIQGIYNFLNSFTGVAGRWTQISMWPVQTA